MKYMLDTNICIYVIKNKPKEVFLKLQKYNPDQICISSITYAELVYGVEKSQLKDRNRLALTMFLSNIEILDFDYKAAEKYGEIKAYLEKKGTPIGQFDTLIAGHAKSLGYTVVTNNIKEFERVKNLKVENWVC